MTLGLSEYRCLHLQFWIISLFNTSKFSRNISINIYNNVLVVYLGHNVFHFKCNASKAN